MKELEKVERRKHKDVTEERRSRIKALESALKFFPLMSGLLNAIQLCKFHALLIILH